MPIEKEVTGIHKNGEEVTKNMSYILQFIDGTRIMASLLSNLVNNLSEGIHRIKCKFGHDDKKNVKRKFKKRIFNTTKFSNRDNNKLFNVCEEMFILMNI